MDYSASAREPTPGMLLHAAIEKNNWPKAQAVLAMHGATAGAAKNLRGSTPLMLAANGKCGRQNKLLIEELLADGNGGAASAAERNKKGKTAANIAAARGALELSLRLQALEATAAVEEAFGRCPHCATKLRARSRLAFLRDQVMRGKETNPLIVELCQNSAAVEALDVPALHRVNCCLAFRKELTESMALVVEIKRLRHAADSAAASSITKIGLTAKVPMMGANAKDVNAAKVAPDFGCNGVDSSSASEDAPQTTTDSPARGRDIASSVSVAEQPWAGWHVIDLCCGAQCVTAALCLTLLPGATVTAIDLAPFSSLPHFHEAGLASVDNLVPKIDSSSRVNCSHECNGSFQSNAGSSSSHNYSSDQDRTSACGFAQDEVSSQGIHDGAQFRKESAANLNTCSEDSHSINYTCRNVPDHESLASFAYMQEDIHSVNLAARLRARITSLDCNRHYQERLSSQEGTSSRSSAPPYCGNKVVVMAMHCCGALSVRAIELFAQLDAAALLLMPCCLPPKAPRASTSWNPVRPDQAPTPSSENDVETIEEGATDATTKQIRSDLAKSQYGNICGPAAMLEVFATKDQGEQYIRWSQHLCKTCADPTGTATATSVGASVESHNYNVVAQLKTMTPVLSDRNALVTVLRQAGSLSGAA